MKKKIIFSILGAVLLVFAGIYIYISSIDWNNHRERIMEQIMDATGKKVVFGGDLSFSIFPKPYLQAKNVKIYNEGEAEPLAEIPELVSELEVMPFIHGNIQVVKMTMKNPTIYFSVSKDGQLNWQRARKVDEYENYSAEMALNSVLMEDAVVKISDENNRFDSTFTNVTAEVSAESIKGPYRIEGNLVDDKQPIGFAFSIGQHFEGLATAVNVAITHPSSESYIRFDGAMMLENNAFTGNVIAESQRPLIFLQKMFGQSDMGEEFNKPITISTELKSNKNRLDLASFIIKYGRTAGAGNIMIPLTKARPAKNSKKDAVEKPRIEAAFEMTDFDFDMMRGYLKYKFSEYQEGEETFTAKYAYDAAVDLKALKTYYNNYELQNLALSVDVVNDVFVIKQFSVSAPGNTKVAARGRAFSADEQLNYKIEVGMATEDMQRFLFLFDINPKIAVPATYKNAQVGLTISGTPQQMTFDPMTIVFDKMNFSGTAGFIYGDRESIYLSLEAADPVNFDNYIYPLAEEYQEAKITDRLLERFEQLEFLNERDWFLKLKVPAGILDKTYFGETSLDAEIINGYMDLKSLDVADIDESTISMSGGLKGFGDEPEFEKMGFAIESKNFRTLWNDIKFTDELPALFDVDSFKCRGMVSGKEEEFDLKILSTLGNIDITYGGKIYNNYDNPEKFDGSIEIKSQNFASFASMIGYEDIAENLSNSIFSVSGQVMGNDDGFRFDDFEILVAGNGASGNVNIDLSGYKPNISGDVYFSELDFRDFLISKKDAAERNFAVVRKELPAELLQQPELDGTPFSYNLFNFADFSGNIQVKRAVYNNNVSNNLRAKLSIKDGIVQATDIAANLEQGSFSGKFSMDTEDKRDVKGVLNFSGYQLGALNLSGTRYGIESGIADAQIEFASSVDSVEAFFANLTGKVVANAHDLMLKGVDFEKIYADLEVRQKSDGLLIETKESLRSGNTFFNDAKINMNLTKNKWYIENSEISAPKYNAAVSGFFDLGDWLTEMNFAISFPTLKEIPKMYLTLRDSLSNPETSVNVQEIADKYDNYWHAIAEEQERRRIEEEQQRREIMYTVMAKFRSLQNDLQEIVMPNLNAMSEKVKTEDGKAKYNDLFAKAEEIQNEISDVMQMENQEFLSEDDLHYAGDKYNSLNDRMNAIRSEMDSLYESDTKKKYDDLYDECIAFYKEIKADVLAFRADVVHYDGEGVRAYPQIIFEKDEKFVSLHDKIEANYVEIDKTYSAVLDAYYTSSSNKALYQLEQSNNDVEQKMQDMHRRYEEMQKDMDECISYMKERVESAEKAEKKAPEKAKEEKKAEKAKTPAKLLREVGEDEPIKEVKKKEEAEPEPQLGINLRKVDGQNSVVKGKIAKSGGKKPQETQKEEEKASSFLRKVVGETNNVSGSINKKK